MKYSARLIGLSLSMCVRDIVQNKVSLEQVGIIVSSTAAPEERFEDLLERYNMIFWSGKGLPVVDQLLEEGRILQQRSIVGHEIIDVSDHHWVDFFNNPFYGNS